jgi:hypothetical protein
VLAFPDRDDPRDQPAGVRCGETIDVTDSGPHLTHVVLQIQETDGVRIGHHETGVPQNC